ncbi:MAG: ImuA family protein [Vulcanimicrobiaceae bacterium]
MDHTTARKIATLRTQIARIQTATGSGRKETPICFGLSEIDNRLPGNGLRAGLHEVAGLGPETEHAAAPALLIAGILARRDGAVLWVQESPDAYPPGLAGAGLVPGRVIYLHAGRDVLAAFEEGARARGLAGVVGETTARVTLVMSRRLQLAAECSGVPAFLLRRSRCFDDPRLLEPNAAATRWRVGPLPSPAPIAHAPAVPGLARPVWRLDLTRCRGGEAATWFVEAPDAQGHFNLVPDLPDRSAAPDRRGTAGGRAVHHLRS